MIERTINVVDPVCGMTIDGNHAIRLAHAGSAYFFCDPACVDTFREDPARWVDGDGRGTFEHDHRTPTAHRPC